MKIFKKFKPYQIIYLRSITDKQIKLELSQILCSKAERFFIPTDIRIMHPTFAVPDCGYIYTIPQYPIINPQNKNEILTNSELNKMKLEYNYLNVIHLLELFSQNYPQDGGGSSLYGYSFVPGHIFRKLWEYIIMSNI